MVAKKPARKDISAGSSFYPFENLKSVIEKKGVNLSNKPSQSPKKNTPADDETLFADAMKDVREIKEFRRMTAYKKDVLPVHKKYDSDKEVIRILDSIVSGQHALTLSDTQEYIEWINKDCNPILGADFINKMHNGRFSVQDCLDLHGFVIEEAEAEVERFLGASLKSGYSCIKIIHGRGLRSTNGPVIKNTVVKLLSGQFRRHISAFVTARQCDGGLGALYVMLRKK